MGRETAVIEFTSYEETVSEALDRIGAKDIFAAQSHILIKPNLINKSPFPVTTPVACCEAIISYIQECSDAEIVIGEGCGDPHQETDEIFDALGYKVMAERRGAGLIDLNHAPLRRMENPDCRVFPEMYLPEIAMEHYLVSVPVLKAHSLADITGALKNLIGLAPPEHYSGHFGTWKKAVFHQDMHQAIIDLNSYRTPDMSIVDATVGLADFHLGGATCEPPVNRILAGLDPVDVDRTSADLLGLDWKAIPHLA